MVQQLGPSAHAATVDEAAAFGEVVAELIEQIGFGPFDLGSLAESARQEPDSPVYNKDLTVAEARAALSS